MKRILSAMLALCLIAALLPGFVTPAEAASLGGAENCLQDAYYFDESTTKISNWTSAILVKHSGYNYAYTMHAPRNDLLTVTTVADKSDTVAVLNLGKQWKNNIYEYTAHQSNGKEQGFYPGGMVKEGERVTLVFWETETTRGTVEGTAQSFKDGIISLNITGEAKIPLPILNSKNEVCALYFGNGGSAISLFTDEDTFYGRSAPEETAPPATNPPATEPPATNPPATNPPADEPSGSDAGIAVEMPVDLKDLDMLYGEAVIQKKANQSGTVTIAVIVVLVVALVAAVVIIRRKKMQKIKNMLPDAEEGTTLDDGTVLNDEDGTELSEKPVKPAETNLRLQFRNGKRIAPTRSFTIGRAPDNDIVLPNNSSASGHHCEVVVQNGAVCLRDLGSTNGTYVNGRRIAAGQLIQLTPGMVVYLGGPNSSEAFQVTLSGM